MTRKSSCCAICENSNVASICTVCVNYRLNDYNTLLKSLKTVRDSLYMRLSGELMVKNKVDDQHKWRVSQKEKLAQLRQRLHLKEKQLSQGKAELEKMSDDLKVRYGLLESASATMHITSERLHKQSVVIKQICKLFPQRRVNSDGERKDGSSGQYDQICNARLPRGLDPHSIPSEELAASLGYMVQLLNLVVKILAAPALHNSGFAGSCSRIWQRDSYWDARPSSPSNEYPLFIPRQNSCSASVENSWSDRSSSNFGVTSMESERKPQLDTARSSSFNYSSASPHSVETHKDLQKGISLLKKSVACITAYCYNSLYLDVPSETSTFEAFAKLLNTLSSSREIRSVLSLKIPSSRSCEQVQQLNRSFWNVNSAISSSSLAESAHITPTTRNTDNLSNSAASFLSMADMTETRKSESLAEGWDIVEHPTFPPPPSQTEDIEHWTRAMIIDATKR
ncbi:uncharacterized protein LOC131232461 isoform X5 [Magnolia sinica]|uniref:uncharacterized protein LOC131232461 isoform X5 n=1 Tax=Magnolia sinica TaxID=86752 RepID=UPI00265A35E0|nr:uncharacterized protein LOC131232461 isoform X5 [Magnolia sinica]